MNINECGCRPYGWLGLDGNRCIRVIPRHTWQGGMCGRGVCMAGGGMCGWEGACVAGETATAADGTHPTGMFSC